MLFLNNAFTKDITEYDGEVLKEVKTVDGKIYLSNGAIIKEGVVGKFFDIATNDKYGTVFEAGGPDEIGPIVCRFYKLILEFYAEIYVAYNCYLC